MPVVPEISRRQFFKRGLKSTTGLATLSTIALVTRPERVFGANDRVRVAVCGLGGRGWDHVQAYSKLANVEIAALCDVDETVLGQRAVSMAALNLPKPKTFIDARQVMSDKSIDAISIATPNHWHALLGIWACQAGKDVYCEEPCSHNWWEGRQLVRAANKYNRIVQHGTQARSSKGAMEAVGRLQGGEIGDVYLARGICYRRRETIGHKPVVPVPAGVHYDLWAGPAPLRPFTQNRFHYNWRWFWDYGNGEMGSQGVHEIDLARWGLGVRLPNKVSASGGHFMFDDDQETPNILNCTFQFDMSDGKRRMIEFEVRHWFSNSAAEIGSSAFTAAPLPDPTLNVKQNAVPLGKLTTETPPTQAGPKPAPDAGPHDVVGNIFYGSKGYLAINGYDAYKTWLGANQQPGPSGNGQGDHFANFISVIRSRNRQDLRAPIEEAHTSCTLMHLANASYILGRTINFDPAAERVIGDDEADRLLRGTYRAPFVVPQEV
jgi:predicted dehydrogenase